MLSQPATAAPAVPRVTPHLHVDTETCPWCEQEIPPDKLEEIKGKIAVREHEQAQAIMARLEQQYAAERAKAEAKAKADLELERQRSAEREATAREETRRAAEVAAAEKLAEAERNRQQAEAARTVAERASAALQAQLEVQIAELQKAKDAEIAKAQARSAEAEGKLAKLSEEHEQLRKQELEAQREILETAKDDAVNAERAKAFEENQKLTNKVSELQRALEKKTAGELGEGAEINLFEALKQEFPDDRITRIPKGTAGADIIHIAILNGQECGTIIYDSKNHQAFRTEHVAKLKTDQLAANAEHAILSTHKFPRGAGQLHMQDGVLLANPARVIAVVTLIRQHMIQMHTLRLSNAQREEKTAKLYAFMTSERCSELLSRIDAHADNLLKHQLDEQKWHERSWKKQGEALRSIQKAKSDLAHEIWDIIGAHQEESAPEAAE